VDCNVEELEVRVVETMLITGVKDGQSSRIVEGCWGDGHTLTRHTGSAIKHKDRDKHVDRTAGL